MANYAVLDIEQVLYIHDELVKLAGGKHGIRDFPRLHSALERCKTTFGGEDLYPTALDKAAALLHSLMINHAFLDANKCTAYAMMVRFLHANGYAMKVSQEEIVRFCASIDNGAVKGNDIVKWLQRHTQEKK